MSLKSCALLSAVLMIFAGCAAHAQTALDLGASWNTLVLQGSGGQQVNLSLPACQGNACSVEGSASGTGALPASGQYTLTAGTGVGLTLTSAGGGSYSVSEPAAWWLQFQSSTGSFTGQIAWQKAQDGNVSGQLTLTGQLISATGSFASALPAGTAVTLDIYDGAGVASLLGNGNTITGAVAPDSSLAPGSAAGSAPVQAASSPGTATLDLGASWNTLVLQGGGGQQVNLSLPACQANVCSVEGSASGTGALPASGQYTLTTGMGVGLTLTSAGGGAYSVSAPAAWWLQFQSSAGSFTGQIAWQTARDGSVSGQLTLTGQLISATGSFASALPAGTAVTLDIYDGAGVASLLGNGNTITAAVAPDSSLAPGSAAGSVPVQAASSSGTATLDLGASWNTMVLQGGGGQQVNLSLPACQANVCSVEGSASGTGALPASGQYTLTTGPGVGLTLTSAGGGAYSVSAPAAWWLQFQSNAGSVTGQIAWQTARDGSVSGQLTLTGQLISATGSFASALPAGTAVTLDIYDGAGVASLLGNGNTITAAVAPDSALAPGSASGSVPADPPPDSAEPQPPASSAPGTDAYGGLSATTVSAGTGFFRVQKVGEHWTFVDPLGHPYRMLGVFAVDLNTDTPDGAAYTLGKYGSRAAWGLQTVRRLRTWGFNATAEYSSAYVVPVNNEGSYETSEPMPWVAIVRPSYSSLRDSGNYAPEPVKDLVAGLDSVYTDYRADTLPDVFDPNFAIYTNASVAAETSAAEASSSWLVGTAMDDLDDLWGFGPGPDLPAARFSSNIGWIALCTNFQQTANSALGVTAYADGTVYTKYALANWLLAKYGSIAALDAAWGANYTSFGDAGGYGTGTGLLDEDGRDPWVGADDVALTTASAAVRADLNAFLVVFAQKYFSIVSGALRQYRPNQLVFGPCTLNGWNGISRAAILAAAGQYTDVIQANVATQQVYDLSLEEAGDHPIVTWTGMVANPDSDLSAYANPNFPDVYTSQAARGAAYATQVESAFSMTGSAAAGAQAGSQNVIGSKFWAWTDSWGEKTDWGLVTFLDNPYDGVADTPAAGTDAWGYATGGETGSYGNFLGPVASANAAVLASLAAALQW